MLTLAKLIFGNTMLKKKFMSRQCSENNVLRQTHVRRLGMVQPRLGVGPCIFRQLGQNFKFWVLTSLQCLFRPLGSHSNPCNVTAACAVTSFQHDVTMRGAITSPKHHGYRSEVWLCNHQLIMSC